MRRWLAVVAALLSFGCGSAQAAPARTDFSMSIGPSTVSVKAGHQTHYTITLHRGSAYYARIGLTVSGMPRGMTAGFTPFGAGFDPHRTLLLATRRSVRSGSYLLAVRASGGGRAHVRHVRVTVHH